MRGFAPVSFATNAVYVVNYNIDDMNEYVWSSSSRTLTTLVRRTGAPASSQLLYVPAPFFTGP